MEQEKEWNMQSFLKNSILTTALIELAFFLDIIYYMNEYNYNITTRNMFTCGVVLAIVGVILVLLEFLIYPKNKGIFRKLISLISFICAFLWFVPFSNFEMLHFLAVPNLYYQSLSFYTFSTLIIALSCVFLMFSCIDNMFNNLGDFLVSVFKKVKRLFFENKKVVFGLSSVLVVVTSFFFVNHYFFKTPVDVFNGVELTYSGVSGGGVATIDTSNMEKGDQNTSDFLNTVSYEIVESGSLKNGQVITVHASASSELMNDLKIRVPQFRKKFSVSGLSTIPQSKDDVPDIEKLDAILLDDLQKKYDSLGGNSTIKLGETCYSSSPVNYSPDVKYGTYLNIYYIKYYDSFDQSSSTTHEIRGYTGLSINTNGKLYDSYSKFTPRESDYSYGTLINRAELEGLKCEK